MSDKRIRPAYAEGFHCIGPKCEDTCCKGWTVPVDHVTWEKYQALPEGPLRILVDSCVVRRPEVPDARAGAESGRAFATIRLNEKNECPLLTGDRLCRIQSELGEELMSHACATYPRILHTDCGVQEAALTFSCPEAVRLVLLTPELAMRVEEPDEKASGQGGSVNEEPAPANFWPIRDLVLKLVRARSYPLWQRLFLLMLLCQRLDSIARGEIKRSVAAFLGDFEAAAATGSLRAAMDLLPVDGAAQLDTVLKLAGLMLHKSNVTPRFAECIQAFGAGISKRPGATLESLAAQFALAHDRYYAPFFDRYPHIMENILINTIFRCRFPFGKEGMRAGTQPQMAREFALLAAQFALIRGLLIGVAGYHGEAFSEQHVVHTVQTASKHFEHHPEFLAMAHALLVENRMDGARGLAILLRNAEMKRGANEALPASIGLAVTGIESGRNRAPGNITPIPLQN